MSSQKIVRTDDEVDTVIEECYNSEAEGSKFPGMSYEQGVKAGIEWLVGDSDQNPMED